MNRRLLALSLSLALPAIAFPACAQKSTSEKKQPGDVKIACVGDSITYGAAIKDRAAHCYPAQLGILLGDGHSVKNFGVSGTTMLKKGDHPYWTTKPFHAAISWEPDVVVIKLGTNDTKPRNWKHKDQFGADLRAMVQRFRELPSKPQVFVCLPVPAFPERWGIRDSVIRGEVHPAIRAAAKELKCPVIDLYKPLEGKKEFFPDRVHPNKDGAKVIAQTVHKALESTLGKSKKEKRPEPATSKSR